jgi:hypothetical protein
VVLTVLACGGLGAQAKPIRLRNEVIIPKPSTAFAPGNMLAANAAISGLFLVQFRAAPSGELRAELAGAGVDLLHYVPQDTFLARFRNVHLAGVAALPSVAWIGQYRPDHKVHLALKTRLKASATTEPLAVSVLLEPRAGLSEVAQARSAFTTLKQESTLRAGTILRGTVRPAQLDSLARSDAVLWIEAGPKMKLFDEVASKIVAGDGGTHKLLTQVLGYDGLGVSVAVADTGLNNGDAATMHPDLLGRTPAFFWYGNLPDAADEHSHGTHVAGIVAGNGATGEVDDNNALYGLGVAPGASIIAQRIFDATGNEQLPPSFERLTRDATRAGAVVGSNSWGDDTQGRYDTSAMEFDALVRDADGLIPGDQPYILEFSAGNAGPGTQTIGSPAVGKNVIATGASENDRTDMLIYADGPEVMADFSSRGPCEDGRIKPDVIAPGTWISSLQSASASDQYAWAGIDNYYQYQGGTSQAGPHASGAAAVFVQYYRQTHANATPSPALTKAALINSATGLDPSFGNDPVPNMDQGWGRVDLVNLMDPSLSFEFIDQTVLLTNTQVFDHHILVADDTQPLTITLAYTDVPAFPGTLIALVNDLDLEVIAPDGTLYRGNQFDAGESIPNAASPDAINNVEEVLLATPLPGDYLLRVRASNVVQDARQDTSAIDQDFALVTSGGLAATHVGAVIMDRASYTAPSQIQLTVIDTDLAGQPTATVRVTSTTETSGETLVLHAAGANGSFTGAIATATGPALADGKLEIANGDTIQAIYFDASAGLNRFATAVGDLQPPVLTIVAVTNFFGEAVITWTSDEPATSVVRFGSDRSLAGLNQAATDSGLVTAHSIALSGLSPGQTYYFLVASSDAAGNTATNDNAGSFFSFVVNPAATVLVVDEYSAVTDPFGVAPPLSGYTQPLDDLGLNYDVWDVQQLNATPSLGNLRPYRAVFWRVPEFSGAWSVAEQLVISNYLHSGGSLFVASMEVLSRLEEVNATDFIHNVLQVQSYIVDPDSTGATEIIGSSFEPIGSGLDIIMDYSVYDNMWGGLLGPDLSDTITPSPNAMAVFHNDFGDIVGLRWPALGQQAPGRLVFMSTALDAVPMGTGVNDRINLVRNALYFLAPGAPGLATMSLDSSAYNLPSLAAVQLGDANLRGQGTVTITATNITHPAGLSVVLQETTDPGLFLGSLQVVSVTNPPAAGQLRAQGGDTIRVQYFDGVAAVMLSASAVIDTNPPAISGVTAEPDYVQATVSWDTSEPADGLVQFGESHLLGRTAYDADPTTSHVVTFTGLVPDRTYYFRVVSRDLAGNTTIDAAAGALYTFHTLVPLLPPWSDNMNSGATNWSVYSADGSGSAWTLGVPNNGGVTNAHSPPDAWGSNLHGGPIDYAESYLISPAIFLTNGTTATLTFWHWYDFTDQTGYDIEGGELQIITNNTGSVIPLADYSDVSGGWVPESVDLTPYMGQLVYLIWYYQLFSFDTLPRPGWLVDDVAVSVSSVPPGTIQISNNLWQATYILSGPLFRQTNGLGLTISNAPTGRYYVEYAPVPYYNTPASQTNDLGPGGLISFQGLYTFADVNNNGIPDSWEQQVFGNVSPTRTQTTDTDGDGMSDYAEFIAGTNPTNAASFFQVNSEVATNRSATLSWTSAPGRGYRVLGSSDAVNWAPVSNWLRAGPVAGPMSYALPPPVPGGPFLFRLEVSP